MIAHYPVVRRGANDSAETRSTLRRIEEDAKYYEAYLFVESEAVAQSYRDFVGALKRALCTDHCRDGA
jgi:hypothetical protein